MKPWLIPRVTPKNKWYRKWWFALLRTMSIQFDETDGREFKRAASATRFIRALNKGRVIIIFPESTRTSRAEDMGRVMLYSKKGKKIGTLEEGAAFIAIVSGALIVPVWSDEEYGRLPMPWHFPIRIRIGKPLSFKRGTSPEEATQQLTKALLELADQ